MQRSTLVRLAAAALIVMALACTGASGGSIALAQDTDEQGAVVFKDVPCFILVPGMGTVQTSSSHAVVTPSGNATLVCHGELPEGPPETLQFEDLPCPFAGLMGSSSHTVVTRSGQVILVCHVKADKPSQ